MGLVLVTPPAEEPISINEARAHLRVDDDAEDALIEELIQATRDYIEAATSRALITQQWRYVCDRFPVWHESIQLVRAPLVSVESVKYLDTNGVQQTLAANQYVVDTTSTIGQIWLAFGVAWPPTLYQRNAVTIDFTCGYANSSFIPRGLIAALKLYLGDLYMNREASVDGVRANRNPVVDSLLDSYRLQPVR